MKIPRLGDYIRLTRDYEATHHEDDTVVVPLPAGTVMRIIAVNVLPEPQGLQYEVMADDLPDNGIFIDQMDLGDGEWPFELCAPAPNVAKPMRVYRGNFVVTVTIGIDLEVNAASTSQAERLLVEMTQGSPTDDAAEAYEAVERAIQEYEFNAVFDLSSVEEVEDEAPGDPLDHDHSMNG